MKATTKGKIGAGIGGAVGLILGIFVGSTTAGLGGGLLFGLFLAIVGMIGGFGFAFGLKLGVKWCGSAMGIAGATSIFAILFSKDRRTGFLLSFMIFILVFSITIGISYLPGIFMGIRQIKQEKRAS